MNDDFSFLYTTEQIIKKPLYKFEWRQIAILYSTDEKYRETFNLIKDYVEETNSTQLYPLVSVEAYDKAKSIEILKEQSRSDNLFFPSE